MQHYHFGVHQRSPHWGRYAAVLATVVALAGPLPAVSAATQAAASVTLKSSASTRPVGSTIIWTASAISLKNAVYRFSVAAGSGASAVVRDFSPTPSFTWTPLQEGRYTIQATVKDGFAATATQSATATFTVTSRVTGTTAVVNHTANPLVALYSAPACSAGTVTVQFRPASGSAWQSVPAQPCSGSQSVNVLVAGMRASTAYELRDVVANGGQNTTSTALPFTTGKPEAGLQIAKFSVAQAPAAGSDTALPFIFHALNVTPSPKLANPMATDLSGHLVWYYNTLGSGLVEVWPVHMLPSGDVLLFGRDQYRKTGDNVFREIDLAGNMVRETNIDAVNAQLAARGQQKIYAFHHDALRLPNGDTAVLGTTQKTVNGKDIAADMVIVLDSNLQVTWTWDVYNFLTPPATFSPFSGTCLLTGPFSLCSLPDVHAIDWTHANALGWSAPDNDLTLSFRNLSTVIKINYDNGKGNGKILWTLGKGGDFTVKSSNPAIWFSGQHNPNLASPTQLVVFDDGLVRCVAGKIKGCDSRGQLWTLNQQTHTVISVVSVDLGQFWQALGSAQLLPGGNLYFAGGYAPPAREVETLANGTKVFQLTTPLPEYRAYRLATP